VGTRRKEKAADKERERPRRVRRTPEAAREHILGSARALIAEHGPDAVGLKEISRAAGVSRTLIIHYFGGHDGLVQEVLRTSVQRFRNVFLAELRRDGPLDPGAWISLVFDELQRSTMGRLVLWGFLSRRLEGPEAFFHREHGLKLVCDALEERLRAAYGEAVPDRATLERTLVLGIAASWGYALGSRALWSALGRTPSDALDRDARDALGRALLQTALAGRAP
jgi:AcrR family transcriptional regulator